MTTGLFSTYRQGENRVTATFLAVLERLSLGNINRILQVILEDHGFQLVRFQNQVAGKKSVPDARISFDFPLWIETKTARNSAKAPQVLNHLASLNKGERLLRLTPDDDAPKFVADRRDDRLVWSNFRTLRDAIEEILKDDDAPPSEREAFLLREFVSLLTQEKLVSSPEDLVLVVAAHLAWPDYKVLHAYICQPKRSFQPAAHLAFYSEGKIQPLVPRVEETIEAIALEEDQIKSLRAEVRGLAKELIQRIPAHSPDRRGNTAKVLFLSAPDSDETVNLDSEIDNDLPAPFTYGHRYVYLNALRGNPKTTRELLERNADLTPS